MIGREGLAELLVNNAQGKTSLVAAGGGGGCGGGGCGCGGGGGGCGCGDGGGDSGGGYRLHRNNQFDCLIAGLSFWWWW